MRWQWVIATALCLAGCGSKIAPTSDEHQGGEFSVTEQGYGLYLVTDERTSCEYIAIPRAGIILRADDKGNVTPNCPASHNHTAKPLGWEQ